MVEIKEIMRWLSSPFKTFSSAFFIALNRIRLKWDSKALFKRSQAIASQFYTLKDHEDFKEITTAVLNSSNTKNSIKNIIKATGRRFFVFKYPSEDFKIIGYISFIPDPDNHPLLLFLRGGNQLFGLPNPGSDFSCIKNYTVLATCYRGGVSEGCDEFGLNDVNDVENLLKYLPELKKKLNLAFNPSQMFMLGASRGGMEMFLALSKSPQLQQQIAKAVSLCGLLDMKKLITSRPDMKKMFIDNYGLIPSDNEEAWIKKRDPIEVVQYMRKDLPFLIIQGTNDIRLDLEVGYHMVQKLEENGNPVTYLEIEGGDHCLRNRPNCLDLITNWLEK